MLAGDAQAYAAIDACANSSARIAAHDKRRRRVIGAASYAAREYAL
jgi:hypothetical protein